MIKKGDNVVMCNCIEAESSNGKIYKVLEDPVMIGGVGCTFLDGYKGAFCIENLAKVSTKDLEESHADYNAMESRFEIFIAVMMCFVSAIPEIVDRCNDLSELQEYKEYLNDGQAEQIKQMFKDIFQEKI